MLLKVKFSFAQAHGASRMGKCRGLPTAGKLRSHRRDQKWHDTQYKKVHLGIALKANPLGGISHTKGTVLEKVGVEANSQILPSGSVSGFSESRTAKKSLLLYPMMVA